ncbi:twitching motility protein [Richelia sinica FACHB-800]|uniref:Twitching motility protein n=1 Tax=Richelia sinica FACHB-800 TaxID=1357546 RepID=A0A975Y5H0_9NOST|nr:type IV pilus twitching motility protein PilT [Richelia sinica]MBD2666552.1 type IV pilus twitching motility protein PilT [Richelia sinica FACHB-800]QXE24207.1 twitching motility protein [Richelia sinica FACHB-800]
MTEPQSRNLPPVPPPMPTAATQRQATQTLDMSTQRSGSVSGTQNAPPPPPAPAANRVAAPPPPPTPKTTPTPTTQPSRLTLAQIIQEAFDNGYSDVHLGIGETPRFRNRGEIQMTDYPVTDKETFMGWLREIMTDGEIQKFQDNLEFDGATQYEFARVRINVFDTLRGYAMVLRLIPLKILTIEQLRLPPVFRDICHYHKGLILVTGPTGSGKSTTMAAMIDYINREMPKHIITIEDPIEFVHQSRKALIKQREVGMHTRKFDNALKAALREDPDLILVGEMRDKETVNTALKAAQTGHLVMGTLHTNSAVKTIERILNLYSGEEQDAMRVALAESLVAVIAQGLCRTTDGKRAAFHDILINTDAVKDWVKDGKYDEIAELMKQASFDGMVTMNQSLLNLYQEGRITEETALEMSPTPNEMAQFLRGRV